MQFESHGHGGGGAAKCGGPGAPQKRKRGCGDTMDTEAVQTTLEAMRIQVRDLGGVMPGSWTYSPGTTDVPAELMCFARGFIVVQAQQVSDSRGITTTTVCRQKKEHRSVYADLTQGSGGGVFIYTHP